MSETINVMELVLEATATLNAQIAELQSTITAQEETIIQLKADVKWRDGVLAQLVSESVNYIKQQNDLIKRLREDAERLANI